MPRKSPNILLILVDQLRRDALGCYGDPNACTPHLDRLASEGVRFNQACSSNPVCVPYRFSLMTGHTSHSRQVPAISWRMSPCERTLADEFNDAGYQTAYFGKWHLFGGHGTRAMKTPVPREHQGRWQTFAGFDLRNRFFDTVYFENEDPTPIAIDGYQTDGLFNRCITYLSAERRENQPFAAILSVEAPHPPFEAPPELEEKWLARDIELPPNYMHDDPCIDQIYAYSSRTRPKPDPGQTLANRKIYYAMLENLDQNVGRLMQHLRETGLDQNTIVMFTSDHGEFNGAHATTEKQLPYEESVGVPLMVHSPALGIPSGLVVSEPTCTEDLFPTLLGLAGLSPKQPGAGRNLTPLIRGKVSTTGREAVMLEFVAELRSSMPLFGQAWRGVRSARFKYTVLGSLMTGLRPWQLFDLHDDPHEMTNLVDVRAYADIAAQWHGWLRYRMIETGDDVWLASAWGHDDLNPCPVTS